MECLTFRNRRVDLNKNIPATLSQAALEGPRRTLAHLFGLEEKAKRKNKEKIKSKSANIPAQCKSCQAALETGSLFQAALYQISRKQTLANSPGLALFPQHQILAGSPKLKPAKARNTCISVGTQSLTCQTTTTAEPKHVAQNRNIKEENKISSVKRDRSNDDSSENDVSARAGLARSAALSLSAKKAAVFSVLPAVPPVTGERERMRSS